MLGRPGISEPVRKKQIAGAWFTCVVYIDFTKQHSSAIRAVCGRKSLTQAPLCPCWANLVISGRHGRTVWPLVIVLNRAFFTTESGICLPRCFVSSGL